MFKNVSFKVMLAGGNIIILVLLIIISTLLFTSINSLIASSKSVTHTHEVLSHATVLAKAMVDMETGQRGFMLTGNDNFLDPYVAGQKKFDEYVIAAEKLVSDNPEQVKRFEQVAALKELWLKNAGQYEIDLKRKVDKGELPPAALKNVLEGKKIDGTMQSQGYKAGKDIMDDIRVQLTAIEKVEQELLNKRSLQDTKTASFARNTALYGTLLSILIAIGLIIYLTKTLFSQLGAEPKDLQEISQKVAGGDLSVNLSGSSYMSDGTLAKSFSDMVKNLKNLISAIDMNSRKTGDKSSELTQAISEVKRLSDDMSSRSRVVAAASEQASSNMQNIASSVEEISSSIATSATSIEEMSSTISEISKNCQKELAVASEANEKALSTNKLMENLEESADKVGSIIEIIKAIADQTNLLALNATIEAASAGAAGKGFAVVAAEVKELSKQTSKATDDIATQIKDMRSSTKNSVLAISEITEKINEVNMISHTIVSAIEEQSATINEISRNISNVSEATNNVSMNVHESAKGLTEISSNISEFHQSIETITSKMNQGQQSTSDLTGVAGKLKESVGTFKL